MEKNKIKNGIIMLRKLLILLTISILLSSCYTQRTSCLDVEKLGDGQDAVKISKPSYRVKLSVAGNTILAGSAISGGYVGSTINESYITDKYRAANTAIGAAIGFGVSAAIMAIFKPQDIQTKNISDPAKWMEKANDEYVYYGKEGKDFFAFQTSIENQFTPESLEDAQNYSIAFPNSTYRSNVVLKALPRLSRDELVILDSSYQEPQNRNTIREEYIMRANNTCDYISSVKKYPNVISNESETAKQFLSDFDDIICFRGQYPEESMTNSFEDSAIAYIDSYYDLEWFIKNYNQTSKLESAIKQVDNTISTEQYCKLYLIVIDETVVNEENKRILHDKMFEDATSFNDYNYIAKTLSVYTEEAILESQAYIKSYEELKTADSYDVLTKSQINNIIDKAYLNFSFDDLIACANNYPDYSNKSKLGKRSVEKAGTIKQCKAAADTYPNVEPAANDKAYAYAEGDIKKSEEFLDAFPTGDNSLSIVIALVILKADRFNELVSEAGTAIANDDYPRAEKALIEAKEVIPNDNYLDELNAIIHKYNTEKNQYYAEQEAEQERQRRIEDAQPWVVVDFDTFNSSSGNLGGTITLKKTSGKTLRLSLYYGKDTYSDGSHQIYINDNHAFEHNPQSGYLVGLSLDRTLWDVYSQTEALRKAAEITANKYY